MKIRKIVLLIIVLLILFIPAGFFIYDRFCLPQYIINDNTLTYKENIYISKDGLSDTDTENIGKTIGIAVYANKKRELKDYIWPVWVKEYKNDKEHNHIFVIGLMDLGDTYEKNKK